LPVSNALSPALSHKGKGVWPEKATMLIFKKIETIAFVQAQKSPVWGIAVKLRDKSL